MPNDPCERCHERPNSWCVEDGSYICNVCMDEWLVFCRFFVLEFLTTARIAVLR